MTEPGSAHPRDRLKRELSLTDATMLVVASVIGGGIFFTPAEVASLLPAPGWIMAAWATGALLSLAGALANAELGAMFPRAGGDYVYLSEAVHPVAGFLIGWLSFIAIYAGTIAALAAIFAEGVVTRVGVSESWIVPGAVAVTVVVSAINYVGVRWGARANNLTSFFKLAALAAFVVLGPLFGEGDVSRLFASAATGPVSPETAASGTGAAGITAAGFGQALSPILFSYLGWNASVYVASEIRDPQRDLPRSLFVGLALCGGLYLLVNAVYLYALPMAELQAAGDAGHAAALALFGPTGGALVAGFVLISILGTLNATVLVGPRIAYAMALDELFPGGLDRVTRAFQTPGVAILVQTVMTVGLLVVLQRFPAALNFTVFAILLATMADVVALYLLRLRQPERPRPYRAWGYPWVPAFYLLANGGIAVAMLIGQPRECLISIGLLASGLPFYWLFSRWARRRPARDDSGSGGAPRTG
jgi:APA family basic amino acid/polyamine antiporter